MVRNASCGPSPYCSRGCGPPACGLWSVGGLSPPPPASACCVCPMPHAPCPLCRAHAGRLAGTGPAPARAPLRSLPRSRSRSLAPPSSLPRSRPLALLLPCPCSHLTPCTLRQALHPRGRRGAEAAAPPEVVPARLGLGTGVGVGHAPPPPLSPAGGGWAPRRRAPDAACAGLPASVFAVRCASCRVARRAVCHYCTEHPCVRTGWPAPHGAHHWSTAGVWARASAGGTLAGAQPAEAPRAPSSAQPTPRNRALHSGHRPASSPVAPPPAAPRQLDPAQGSTVRDQAFGTAADRLASLQACRPSASAATRRAAAFGQCVRAGVRACLEAQQPCCARRGVALVLPRPGEARQASTAPISASRACAAPVGAVLEPG